MPNQPPDQDPDAQTSMNPRENPTDNDFTELDEHSYTVLDEENQREVASRGGDANYTQNQEAELPVGDDDAEIREGTLPVQDLPDDTS